MAATVASTDLESPRLHLTVWGHVWRFALMLTISAVGWISAVDAEAAIGAWLVVLDLCLGVIAFVLVSWRRRWPFAVALALGLMSTVSVTSSGPGVIAMATLATGRRAREVAPVAAITMLCWILYELLIDSPLSMVQVVSFTVVVIAAAVAVGTYTGYRRSGGRHVDFPRERDNLLPEAESTVPKPRA